MTSRIVLACALAAAGCGSREMSKSEALLAAMLDPCGGPGAPCSIAEAAPAAHVRTDELSSLVEQQLASGADLVSAAAWLREQDGVVSVATGEEAVRFRVRDGVGHWVFVRTAGTVGTLAAVSLPMPPTMPSPGRAEPPSLQNEGPGPTVRDRRRKRALLLSPFRWQWEISGRTDGIDLVAATLRARDYRVEDVSVLTTRLDLTNEACHSTKRWPDCRVINQIQPAHFMSWRQYDYVHLLTHGAAVRDDGHSLAAVMSPWTLSAVEAAEERYTGEALEIVHRVGTETASVAISVPRDAVPMVGPGQVFGAGPTGAAVRGEEGTSALDPALTVSEREWCQTQLKTQSDADRHAAGKPLAKTQDGKQCLKYSVTKESTGKFVVLSSRFFFETYDDGAGVDNAVILISACSSAVSPDLLGALNGKQTAVIGWKKSVSIGAAALAGTLIAKALVEVDQPVEAESGRTVRQALLGIARLLDDAARNPPSKDECTGAADEELETRCLLAYDTAALTVVNGEPADPVTGASIALIGDETVRAREVPYLMDRNGEELADGAVLVTRRAPDGSGDTLDLTIRVDGLALQHDPTDVALAIAIDDRVIPVTQPLNRRMADGVWELDYRLPLGRHYAESETVDLEVRATPAGTHESTWLYEDIRLAGNVVNVGATAYGVTEAWFGLGHVPGQARSCLLTINLTSAGAVGDENVIVTLSGVFDAPPRPRLLGVQLGPDLRPGMAAAQVTLPCALGGCVESGPWKGQKFRLVDFSGELEVQSITPVYAMGRFDMVGNEYSRPRVSGVFAVALGGRARLRDGHPCAPAPRIP